jgi:hypothetical protein
MCCRDVWQAGTHSTHRQSEEFHRQADRRTGAHAPRRKILTRTRTTLMNTMTWCLVRGEKGVTHPLHEKGQPTRQERK